MTPTPNTPPRSSSPGAATSPPATLTAGGGFPISEAREAELLRAVPRLHCAGEIEGFRAQMAEQGEKPTGAVEAALVRQAERFRQC